MAITKSDIEALLSDLFAANERPSDRDESHPYIAAVREAQKLIYPPDAWDASYYVVRSYLAALQDSIPDSGEGQ